MLQTNHLLCVLFQLSSEFIGHTNLGSLIVMKKKKACYDVRERCVEPERLPATEIWIFLPFKMWKSTALLAPSYTKILHAEKYHDWQHAWFTPRLGVFQVKDMEN